MNYVTRRYPYKTEKESYIKAQEVEERSVLALEIKQTMILKP